MEYPYECAEQLFNRYYANTLASSIANASPAVKQVFERWKTADTAALLSNLREKPGTEISVAAGNPLGIAGKK